MMQTQQLTGLEPRQEWKAHSYQTMGANALLTHNALGLILFPGMGKTSITLFAISQLKKAGYTGNFLVIAPLKVAKTVWAQECAKWQGLENLSVHVLHGKGKHLNAKANIYVINFEGLRWLMTDAKGKTTRAKLNALGISGLVIDEVSKFKHTNTSRFKLMKPYLSSFEYRWALTGSLMPRHYMDLFGVMYVIDLGKSLGKYITHYRSAFFDQGYDGYSYTLKVGEDGSDIHTKAEIQRRIAPSLFVIPEDEYLTLPPMVGVNIPVELSAKDMQTYKRLHNEFVIELKREDVAVPSAAAKINKCLQFLSGAVYNEDKEVVKLHSAKLDALDELIESLGGEQLLIGYYYRHEADRLREIYGDRIRVLGGGSKDKTEDVVAMWNSGELELLAIQPQAGGHGLNLQGSNAQHLAWLTLNYDWDTIDQTIRRIRRQGNKSSKIFVYNLIVPGTMDSVVQQILLQKDTKQANLVKSLSDLMTKL